MEGRMDAAKVWWVEWTEPFTDEPTKPVHQSDSMTKDAAEELAAELRDAGKDDVHLAYSDPFETDDARCP